VLAGADRRTRLSGTTADSDLQRVIEIRRDDLRSGHESLEVDGRYSIPIFSSM